MYGRERMERRLPACLYFTMQAGSLRSIRSPRKDMLLSHLPNPYRITAILWLLGLWLRPNNTIAAPQAAFQLAVPGYRYQFPRDHAAHPAYATEWWYYTGHLQATNGQRFGYELTFFRVGLLPQLTGRTSHWATRDVILAHFALTDESSNKFFYTDRASRAVLGLAGAAVPTPHVWLGDWVARFAPHGDQQSLRASGQSGGTDFALSLTQHPLKPLILHGAGGVSQKAAGLGHASHYYSFTRLATRGVVRLGNTRYAVTGQSWFDHEFGSNQLGKDQAGWDWFSMQLEDGRELMLYRMRLRNGNTDPYSSGTLVERNGTAHHLTLQDFKIEALSTWHSPISNANYPSHWRVTLPRLAMRFDIMPTVANQELVTQRSTSVTYWEGSVRVTGTGQGRPLHGVGYVELTGYAGGFSQTF